MNGFANHTAQSQGRWETYDVVVVGATPGGVACSIRCARENLRVLLVEASDTVGGMWASGVQVFDTRYGGHRCPILSEFVERLDEFYRSTCGEASPDHLLARYGDPSKHGERPRFEPHVAEKILLEMLGDTRGVRLVTGHRLSGVEKQGGTIRGAVFQTTTTPTETLRAAAAIFVDSTYEADLAAAAGATFRVGRESRAEFGEPHAGVHFTTIEPIGEIGQNLRRQLNLHFFNRTSRRQFADSSGAGDRAVQAYTVRLILTDRPENRRPIFRPQGYSREQYLGILDRSPDAHSRRYPLSSHLLHGSIDHFRLVHNVPNGKMDWLGANLVGGNHDYPHASAKRRRELYQAHLDHALGLLHFLQTDAAVPLKVREHVGAWGLALDEYRGSDGLPPFMYVRESRRLMGLHAFSEHDASCHPSHQRTPIHGDSIAFAEWPMDSHDCNPQRLPGSFNDGEFILAETTLPSQVPFRVLLTEAVDNLLVPVAMSATHVGWGTLRLEPVFVHTGEVAGVAAASCLRANRSLASLEAPKLQWELLQRRIAISYLSDLDLGRDDSRDLQYLSVRGFIPSYAARPEDPLRADTAEVWAHLLTRIIRGEEDGNAAAAQFFQTARARDATPSRVSEPAKNLLQRNGWGKDVTTTVRQAARIMVRAMAEIETATASA